MEKFGIVKKIHYLCSRKKDEVMFYIYEKNMNTNSVKVFTKVRDKRVAEHKVMEMNEDSLFDDKYYFIKEVNGE